MKSEIFFADSRLKNEIEALRMQEYAKATGFELDLSTLKWNHSDDESYVIAARRGDQLVSTMRGEVIEDPQVLEQKLECPWSFPYDLQLPVLLLSRAATLSTERASGLNLALRFHFLRLAQEHGIRHVVGTFVSGSPRERTLQAMGYQFFENTLGWQQSTYRSLRPVTVAVLDLKSQGKKALAYCETHAARALNEFRFEERFPELKYVRRL